MAITTQVITTAVMRGVGNFVGQFRHAFQRLMKLTEIVDVFFDFLIDTEWMIIKRIVDGGLNFNLHDIPGLINGVDRSLAAIAGVMDHDGLSNRVKDTRRDQPDADQKEANKKCSSRVCLYVSDHRSRFASQKTDSFYESNGPLFSPPGGAGLDLS